MSEFDASDPWTREGNVVPDEEETTEDALRRFALAIQRVRDIHRPVEYTVPGVRVVTVCMECRLHSARIPYPCRTINALDGAS